MIKVTVGEQKTQEEKPFPKLMKHTDGTITFFQSNSKGTHIYAREHMSDIIGIRSNEINMSEYTDFNEPITLQNQ